LAKAIEASNEVQAALAEVTATHVRSVEHLESCKAALGEFDELEAEITRHTVGALQAGGRADLTDELFEKVSARGHAKADRFAAESALGMIEAELARVQKASQARGNAAHAAAVAVLGCLADAKAHRHAAIEAEMMGIRASLAQFDRLATLVGVNMSPGVLTVLRTNKVPMAPKIESPWTVARDTLLADPTANVDI
jgi:hypothetical protein